MSFRTSVVRSKRIPHKAEKNLQKTSDTQESIRYGETKINSVFMNQVACERCSDSRLFDFKIGKILCITILSLFFVDIFNSCSRTD